MRRMLSSLFTALDLLLVVVCFGLIIFIHELGHFLAARWAGIRVLAFAIGFGPAAFSYRKGLGLRRGSSEAAYAAELKESNLDPRDPGAPSPTEYRFNWLPFGGYVKMLGQEDMHPDRVSREPDSYQSARPWKRMVVISAGVVFNVIAAAALFIVVFMVGLKTEPAVVGSVVPGLPASKAAAVNSDEIGLATGLRPGDRILSINGREPNSFNDLVLASAMAKPGKPVRLTVQRDGVAAPLRFEITPEPGPLSKLLELGIEPLRSAELLDLGTPKARGDWDRQMGRIGLPGVDPGARLFRAGDNTQVVSAHDLEAAVDAAGGQPVEVVFENPDGKAVAGALRPRARLESALLPKGPATVVPVEHILGLTPVMTVADTERRGEEQGLRKGDVVVRVGAIEFPAMAEGMGEIRAARGKRIDFTVLRRDEATGETAEVALRPLVTAKGQIGFYAGDTADDSTLLALPPARLILLESSGAEVSPAAHGVIDRPGTTIQRVGGREVATLRDVREALRAETRAAFDSGGASVTVALEVTLPGPAGGTPSTIEWTIARPHLFRLHALGWQSPLGVAMFKPAETRLVATDPVHAVRMGLEETRRVMISTYVTFVRLFEGSVKVEHLKGPVGIAHLGTRIAARGPIWLMFFMALVSVNLAVVNFLPLPIVDGGQFLFLLVEQARGKPAPMALQNGLTMAGMALIVAMFLLVTFNDIRGIFGG